MQRDVRTEDNWALSLAFQLAKDRGQTLKVVYALPPPPTKKETIPSLVNLPMNKRLADFLLGGLELVHKELKTMNIPLHIVHASSHRKVGETVCKELEHASVVVSDFSPIREYREWMEVQAKPILEDKKIPFFQVDAHNIVPVWEASEKREYAARTIRKKIHNVLNDYLEMDPPKIESENKKSTSCPAFKRSDHEAFLKIDDSVKPAKWAKPGKKEAMKLFDEFCETSLDDFDRLRNDPNSDVCSNLSPWINHGHISAQRLIKELTDRAGGSEGCDTYVEEMVVRRELADNFIYYTPNKYDSLDAAYDWAKETLEDHKNDTREHLYSLEELEEGKTHEDIWNAAQLQMVQEGHMHGFLRMYWSKKVSAMERIVCRASTTTTNNIFISTYTVFSFLNK